MSARFLLWDGRSDGKSSVPRRAFVNRRVSSSSKRSGGAEACSDDNFPPKRDTRHDKPLNETASIPKTLVSLKKTKTDLTVLLLFFCGKTNYAQSPPQM